MRIIFVLGSLVISIIFIMSLFSDALNQAIEQKISQAQADAMRIQQQEQSKNGTVNYHLLQVV